MFCNVFGLMQKWAVPSNFIQFELENIEAFEFRRMPRGVELGAVMS
jgi:hypothetical protein